MKAQNLRITSFMMAPKPRRPAARFQQNINSLPILSRKIQPLPNFITRNSGNSGLERRFLLSPVLVTGGGHGFW
jgi:hypothetical protein